MYRLDQYIPDALYESYESLRDNILVWLIRFGLIGKAFTAKVDSTLPDAPREWRQITCLSARELIA